MLTCNCSPSSSASTRKPQASNKVCQVLGGIVARDEQQSPNGPRHRKGDLLAEFR
jgi:hypothetical protein